MLKKLIKNIEKEVSNGAKSIEKGFNLSKNFVSESYNELELQSKKIYESIDISKLFSVSKSETENEFDTMHYFLIPDIENNGEYILHTHREIPNTVINESKLIKRKMFHVPSNESFQILKNKVLKESASEYKEDSDISLVGANALKEISNNIDKSNYYMTSGLLTIGVGVLLINPITGVAILGSSLLPSFATDFITGVTNSFANNLSKKSDIKRSQEAEKMALKELNKIEPTIHINSVLNKIENCIKDADYNPIIEVSDSKEDLSLIRNVILEMYSPIVNKKSLFSKSKINDNLKNYIYVLNGNTR